LISKASGKKARRKPGSVVGSYLSRRYVAIPLKRSTFAARGGLARLITMYFLLREGFT